MPTCGYWLSGLHNRVHYHIQSGGRLMNLTENEYNLGVYCLEQQMYEFNKDEQNDANNIVIKLSNLVESK